ncbi:SpoIIE family protein phosphatase [Cryptosporangium phraense]|uniref:SpoIIE family protein phosphatase n=1 Tax=Cryptosporangium phraense TaxID=2593070 RepID=UPI00147971B3|nr:SpoIIE family protein phosphatase [Cryptosporangium phraense]
MTDDYASNDPAVGGLSTAAHLAALRDTGLAAAPDAALDRFAGLVRKILGIPLVLVSLIDGERQIFPGAAGLSWAQAAERQEPGSHSFGRQVTVSGRPLVISDARHRPGSAVNPKAHNLTVVAFAGMPLTDDRGQVLGALCAIDNQPRAWSARDLDLLADLAASCSSELQLRITARRAELDSQRSADASAARRDAQAQADRLAGDVDTALRHSRVLLGASETLQGARTVDDVVHAVADLVRGDLAPTHVGIMLLDTVGGQLNLVTAMPLPADQAERWTTVPADSDQSAARAVRERRPLFFRDRDDFEASFPGQIGDLDRIGWQALVCAPLLGSDGPLGTLRIAWGHPQRLDVGERAVVLSLAGYVTQALERAQHLHDRTTVAETLQRAMLTELPAAPPYQLAARYQPASRVEKVGGDWYDAVALPANRIALVIGDVTGHDIGAAAQMGQLRSMLRAYLVDREADPADVLQRLDAANHTVGDRTLATALVAVVEPRSVIESDGEHGWKGDRDRTSGLSHVVRWSTAGHPPPILLNTDGSTRLLTATGLILGVRPKTRRAAHSLPLPTEGTLLLYTDGLVESRTAPLDEGIARLRQFLALYGHLPLDNLLDALLTRHLPDTHHDDVAILALRTP